MTFTQADILRSGYRLPAAPVDAWRIYDEVDPVPGYFQFDWLSSRHPDLYHRFALTSVGLIEKLHTLFDLTDQDVVDIGAGTGRSALGVAAKAKRVFAVDLYAAVVAFGKAQAEQTNAANVHYLIGDRSYLPLANNSMDVAINTWAELNAHDAYRVIKPGGYLIQLGSTPDALCGELTTLLAPDYPWIPEESAPPEVFAADYPDTHLTIDSATWNDIPVTAPVEIHQFTHVVDYQDYVETAAMMGRLYGPKAKHYFMERKQATFAWRLQIAIGQVRK